VSEKSSPAIWTGTRRRETKYPRLDVIAERFSNLLDAVLDAVLEIDERIFSPERLLNLRPG
jgi:hypothetical protein